MSQEILDQVRRRRTFAIISHPDAGKTTLTEKLLLFSGAIQSAGTVKGKKSGKFATSDWMEIEKQRGISVASSVMQFDYKDHTVNLLDTPGHQDFSEDTYRVLTAVDSALMVIDAAKGVEAQTKKRLQYAPYPFQAASNAKGSLKTVFNPFNQPINPNEFSHVPRNPRPSAPPPHLCHHLPPRRG